MPDHPAPLSRAKAVRALLNHPALPALIPDLPAGTLARLYDAVGMNDAGSLMALTPAPLLAQALDEAAWTRQGSNTRFDPDVFVDWLEVWLEEGEDFAVERLLALDEDMLALCLGQLLHIEDSHTTAFEREPDDPNGFLAPGADAELFGRFLVTAAIPDEWTLVRAALTALWSEAPDTLLAILERLTVGDSRPEDFHRPGELHDDAAGAHGDRRERSGFVAPETAGAFLGHGRTAALPALAAMTDYDPETRRYLDRLERARQAAPHPPAAPHPAADPEPQSHTPAGASAVEEESDTPPDHTDASSAEPRDAPALWTLLAAAGVAAEVSADRLLSGPASASALTLRRRLDALAADQPERLNHAATELSYLANLVLSGTTLPAGAREADARELAWATANLGLEVLEANGYPVDIGRPPGLVRAFLAGWRTLADLPEALARAFDRGVMSAAMRRSLEGRPWLEQQIEESLDDLRTAVRARDFASARESAGLLSLAFDTDACRAAAHLLNDPPRFPGLLEGGDKDATRWVRNLEDLERLGRLLHRLEAP